MGMLEPKKVKVGGVEYMIGRLDLFEAMNLSRICAPILPVLFHEVLSRVALAVLQSKKEDESTPEERIEETATADALRGAPSAEKTGH